MRARRLAAAFAFLLGAASASARADFEPDGSLAATALVAEGALGGGLLADVVAPAGVFRFGLAFGMGAVTSDDDARSRVLMPAGVSLGLALRSHAGLWLDARVRVGGWAGATREGLAGGAFIAPGLHLGYAFGPRVSLGVTVDGWLATGHGDLFALAPGLALTWTAPEA